MPATTFKLALRSRIHRWPERCGDGSSLLMVNRRGWRRLT